MSKSTKVRDVVTLNRATRVVIPEGDKAAWLLIQDSNPGPSMVQLSPVVRAKLGDLITETRTSAADAPKVDQSIPAGEVHARQGGETVGRIVGLSAAEDVGSDQPVRDVLARSDSQIRADAILAAEREYDVNEQAGGDCCDVSDGQYNCTRANNHSGLHVALGSSPVAVWDA